MIRRPPRSTLFPYTLFRSQGTARRVAEGGCQVGSGGEKRANSFDLAHGIAYGKGEWRPQKKETWRKQAERRHSASSCGGRAKSGEWLWRPSVKPPRCRQGTTVRWRREICRNCLAASSGGPSCAATLAWWGWRKARG